MQVELIYARPDFVFCERLELDINASVRTALQHTSLWRRYPELDPQTVSYGIYGKRVTADTCLKQYDRIEIYHPLKARTGKRK